MLQRRQITKCFAATAMVAAFYPPARAGSVARADAAALYGSISRTVRAYDAQGIHHVV